MVFLYSVLFRLEVVEGFGLGCHMLKNTEKLQKDCPGEENMSRKARWKEHALPVKQQQHG